ncbi:DUF4349 domain-containing protein [Chitinophaga sp. NPDC101104]|uniref:DUF4349 domain-containing protein n=1 Tax=Chitinophaga sp. NPDC101104 TaxID=3390561 RepID=UPI003D075687
MQRHSMLWAAALLPVLTLYACGHNLESARQADSETVSDSTYPSPADVSLNAATIPEKRVKTGEMRLQVDNVVQATVRMEQLVTRAGGIVEQSEIRQTSGRQDDTRYSSDSLRRVTWYAPEATLRLRVPVRMMDSVVHAITGMAAFVEFRSLADADLSLQHLQNNLLNHLTQQPGRALEHTKPDQELDVRQYEDEAKRGAIGRTIENLGIDQLAAFSTLTVNLRQPDLAVVSIIPDPEKFARSYFMADASQALGNGLSGFRAALIFLLNIWPLLLVAGITWFLYRRWIPRLKVAAAEKTQP